MKQSIVPESTKGGINLEDMIVSPPLASAKPGEKILEKKSATSDKNVPGAPKLIMPLAFKPPTVAPVAEENAAASVPEDVAPHSYDHIFIMEQLDKLATDPFVGDVRTLPIPTSIIEAVEKLIKGFKNVHANMNAAIHERNEVDKQMKNATFEFVI